VSEIPTSDEVLAVLSDMLEDVMGALLMVDEITMETTFAEDLELESIDFVALAELVMDRWGDRVDFTIWISDMDLEQIVNLSVGDVVSFIREQLNSTEGTT